MTELLVLIGEKIISLFVGVIITIAGVFSINTDMSSTRIVYTPDISLKEQKRTALFGESFTMQATSTEPKNGVLKSNTDGLAPEVEKDEKGSIGTEESVYADSFSTIIKKTQELVADTSRTMRDISAYNEAPLIDADKLNTLIRPAVVNLYCTARANGDMEPISGSGVLIDSRGIILTNAHVAQYFLLDTDGNGIVSCVVRVAGSYSKVYRAQPLYISSEWIRENTGVITGQKDGGTGENDYGFLIITGPVSDAESRPDAFVSILPELSEHEIQKDSYALLASYPAELLGGVSVNRDLSLLSSIGEITGFLTFNGVPSENLDAIEVSGNILSQRGSSGGALISLRTGKLIGIISVSSKGDTTESRILRAITPSHINRALALEAGVGLPSVISGDIFEASGVFLSGTGKELREILLDAIFGGSGI